MKTKRSWFVAALVVFALGSGVVGISSARGRNGATRLPGHCPVSELEFPALDRLIGQLAAEAREAPAN
jgi:hypothetical protein